MVSSLVSTLSPEERHRRDSPGLRRVNLALFVAGLTTFISLYSAQALLRARSSAATLSSDHWWRVCAWCARASRPRTA